MRGLSFTCWLLAMCLVAYGCTRNDQCRCDHQIGQCYDTLKQKLCRDKCDRSEDCVCIANTCLNGHDFDDLNGAIDRSDNVEVAMETDLKTFTSDFVPLFGKMGGDFHLS